MARSAKKNAKQEPKSPAFIACHVPDRENVFWTKIGATWDHKDGGGFTLQLDLAPVATGRIEI